MLPFELNGYEFLEYLGSGTYASTFVVRSVKYNIKYCAKVTRLEIDLIDENGNLYEPELCALTTLDHPNVIRLFQYFVYGNYLILILELLHPKSTVPLKMRPMVESLVSAIGYIHGNNIAHRDIKPSNILYDIYNRPKLADFGLSAWWNFTESMELQQRLEVCGSKPYLAPELFMAFNINNNEKNFHSALPKLYQSCNHILNRNISLKDHDQNSQSQRYFHFDPLKADIWALGVTLYEIAFGRLPWPCNNSATLNNKSELCSENMENKEENLSLRRGIEETDEINILNIDEEIERRKHVEIPEDVEIDPDLKELILKMLTFNPLLRPSAEELVLDKYILKHYDDCETFEFGKSTRKTNLPIPTFGTKKVVKRFSNIIVAPIGICKIKHVRSLHPSFSSRGRKSCLPSFNSGKTIDTF